MDNKHIIICVGRQLGSGGHDIGRMLAMDFNARYYDKDILKLAAKESGFSMEFFEQNDERHGFLRSVFHARTPHITDNNFYQNNFSQEALFKFFITASMKFRIDNVVNRQGVLPDEARKLIEQGERRRSEYYNYYTGKRWGQADGYDLCIDSSILGFLDTEKIIVEFIKKRFDL